MKQGYEQVYWMSSVREGFEFGRKVVECLEKGALVLGTTGENLGTTPEQFEGLVERFFEERGWRFWILFSSFCQLLAFKGFLSDRVTVSYSNPRNPVSDSYQLLGKEVIPPKNSPPL